jgi:serine/threonine protein kinase
VAPNAFLNHLKESRLLSEEQLGHVSRLSEGVAEEDLPHALIDDGILTPLQAHRVASGNFRSLVLGPYHLQEEIGRGGMGRVYKALHTVMGRIVALKLMSPETVQDERSREMFLREVRSVTRLSHPNIVMAHDANEAEGVLFLAMEYVAGTTLAELVRTEGPLPVARACECMRQTALGLQHAHQMGVVHRDIKPANLLIPQPTEKLQIADCRLQNDKAEEGGEDFSCDNPQSENVLVKIADFGLARLGGLHGGETVARHTASGCIGTPDYVSPEQCEGERVDIRSDLYSLGCTFHFALTGRVPFPGDSVMEKLWAHAMTPPPPVVELRPEVPAGVAAIVARLLAKNPDQRFQTPVELALALAPWCEGSRQSGPPAGTTPNDQPDGRRATHDATRVIERARAATPLFHRAAPTVAGPAPGIEPDRCASSLSATSPVNECRDEVQERTGAVGAPEPTLSLSQAWARWTAVIEDLARQPGLLPSDEQAYRKLHRSLLEQCAAHALRASEKRAMHLQQLDDLVRPWLSLVILARTERALLQDLAQRARQYGRALGLQSESQGWGLLLAALALLLVVLAFPALKPLAGQVSAFRSGQPLPVSLSRAFDAAGWRIVFLAPVALFPVWLLSRRR